MSVRPTHAFVCKLLVISNGHGSQSPHRQFEMSVLELSAPFRSFRVFLQAAQGPVIELFDHNWNPIEIKTEAQGNASTGILVRALKLFKRLEQENAVHVEIYEQGTPLEKLEFEMGYRLCSPLPVACA